MLFEVSGGVIRILVNERKARGVVTWWDVFRAPWPEDQKDVICIAKGWIVGSRQLACILRKRPGEAGVMKQGGGYLEIYQIV